MQVQFSEHALARIKQRNIPKRYVIQTVLHPIHIDNSYRGRKKYSKTIEGRTLEVVTIVENDIIIIITCYFLNL